MLVVGHSEGGFFAMLVADTVSTHPAGLALLEPQDERILSQLALQLDEQLDSAVKQGQLSTSAAQQQAQGISNAITQFRAGQRWTPRPAAADRAAAHPGAAHARERQGRADRRRGQPGPGGGQGGGGHPGPGHRRHRRHEHPGQHHQPADQRADQRRDQRPGLAVLTGINHYLHGPGTPDNDAVLAPSVVAAIKAWAQPYATAG